MRLAVISDIHGNAPALRAVLENLRNHKPDRIVCAGDVVGYGPCPRECIDLVRDHNIPCVLGNHDEYTTQIGAHETWHIRPAAMESILWTQQALDADRVAWLAALPRTLEIDGLQIVHSSHLYWPRWDYVTNPEKAAGSFLFQKTRVAFNGHTHLPILASHRRGTPPTLARLRSGRLPNDSHVKLLVGVGAVGQPRDRDPRAAAVLFDTEKGDLRLLRVPYNIAQTQRLTREVGLPANLAERLDHGR